MGTVRKTITPTDRQDRWVEGRIAAGGFADDGAYIRDPVRRDQEQDAGVQALQAAIREGVDSGASDKTVPRSDRRPDAAPTGSRRS